MVWAKARQSCVADNNRHPFSFQTTTPTKIRQCSVHGFNHAQNWRELVFKPQKFTIRSLIGTSATIAKYLFLVSTVRIRIRTASHEVGSVSTQTCWIDFKANLSSIREFWYGLEHAQTYPFPPNTSSLFQSIGLSRLRLRSISAREEIFSEFQQLVLVVWALRNISSCRPVQSHQMITNQCSLQDFKYERAHVTCSKITVVDKIKQAATSKKSPAKQVMQAQLKDLQRRNSTYARFSSGAVSSLH